MNSKKYIKMTLTVLCLLLTVTASLNFVFDPLLQYHEPFFGFFPLITNETYQNAGIAKTIRFDNAFIGNSQSENYDLKTANKLFGGNTVNLSIPGAFCDSYKSLLEILSKKKVEKLFIQIDNFYLTNENDTNTCDLPEHLYNSTFLDDPLYLCNFSVLCDFTGPMIVGNIKKDIPPEPLSDIKLIFNDNKKNTALKGFNDQDETNELLTRWIAAWDDIDKLTEYCRNNVQMLVDYSEKMQDTEFYVYFIPCSMFLWNKIISENKLPVMQTLYSEACRILTSRDNIKLFLLSDEEMTESVAVSENYYDWLHFHTDINDLILNHLHNEVGRITAADYTSEVEKYFEYLKEFDYESILKQKNAAAP